MGWKTIETGIDDTGAPDEGYPPTDDRRDQTPIQTTSEAPYDVAPPEIPAEPQEPNGGEEEEPTDTNIDTAQTDTDIDQEVPNYELNCREYEFACKDGSECIPLERKCDDYTDCADNSDEENCPIDQDRPEDYDEPPAGKEWSWSDVHNFINAEPNVLTHDPA